MIARRLVLAICLLASAGTAHASATFAVVNGDDPGEGFNDPTPTAPVGGNAGTTRGEQRLLAFEYATQVWGDLLNSAIEIRMGGAFSNLPCGGGGAILGSAGPEAAHRDFTGAPLPGTWYPSALADRLAGVDLDPGELDLSAVFSSAIDTGCLGGFSGWYYGLDGAPPPGQLDFVSVLLHEIAHGIGFLTFVSSGGVKLLGFDDAYMLHLEDHGTGLTFPSMTDGQRQAASTVGASLHWVGANVVAEGGFLVSGRHPTGHVEVFAPSPYQPGSSVSHFSTSLSPNELMEPSLTADPTLTLTVAALADVGWTICGDGLVDPDEECDDGARVAGDGCSKTCVVEPCHSCGGEPSVCVSDGDGTSCNDGNGCTTTDTCLAGTCAGTPDDGAPCDDGTVCTANDVCGGGVCVGVAPLPGPCIPVDFPAASTLKLLDKSPNAKDRLVWKWSKGSSAGLFGDPTTSTDFTLCVYDGTNALRMSHRIGSGPAWSAKSTGFRFLDKNGAQDGIVKIALRDGDTSSAKILLKGKGTGLGMTDLTTLPTPVVVQMTNGGACWQADFDTNVIRSDETLFKAKSD